MKKIASLLLLLALLSPLASQAQSLGQKLSGKLLLQVENRGRIWYISPTDQKRYEVTFANALPLFESQSLGISNNDLNKIPIAPESVSLDHDSDGDGFSDYDEVISGYNPFGPEKLSYDLNLSKRLAGKLLLQVEQRGKIWYVDFNGKRWNVTFSNLLNLFRKLSLGITNADLEKIEARYFSSPSSTSSPAPIQPTEETLPPPPAESQSDVEVTTPPSVQPQETAPAPEVPEEPAKPVVVANEDCRNKNCLSTPVDYIIISREMFTDTLQEFIQAKQKDGYKTGLMTVSFINEHYQNGNVSDKIRSFITETHTSTKYYLLVGDTRVKESFKFQPENISDITSSMAGMYDMTLPWNVPSGYVILQNDLSLPMGAAAHTGMMLSDTYYTDLDKDWDQDKNNVLDLQLYQEVFDYEAIVGRWPVRTTKQLQNIINKTTTSSPSNHMNYMGSDEWKYINTSEDRAKCIDQDNYLKNEGRFSLECLMYRFFEPSKITYSLIHNNPSAEHKALPINERTLRNYNKDFRKFLLNNQHPIYVNYHGSTTEIDGITIDDFKDYKYTFPMYDMQSCSIVHYFLGDEDTFAEAMLRAEKGPASLVSVPNSTAFYSKLLEGKTIGEAFYPKETKWAHNRWYVSLFGDPSLKVFDVN